MKPLVIGLGNDLMSDDGVGILAARKLAGEIGSEADVVASNLHGIALLDLFIGYEKAIVIDAVKLPGFRPGTIIELDVDDLRPISGPSPHYTGFPELIRIAGELELDFPDEIKIFAVNVADPYTIGGKLSGTVADVMGRLILYVKSYVRWWNREGQTHSRADALNTGGA
jgi:hydrogenase maturation protease